VQFQFRFPEAQWTSPLTSVFTVKSGRVEIFQARRSIMVHFVAKTAADDRFALNYIRLALAVTLSANIVVKFAGG
jgi:hypothetical protein